MPGPGHWLQEADTGFQGKEGIISKPPEGVSLTLGCKWVWLSQVNLAESGCQLSGRGAFCKLLWVPMRLLLVVGRCTAHLPAPRALVGHTCCWEGQHVKGWPEPSSRRLRESRQPPCSTHS